MTMRQNTLGPVRLLVVACLYGLSCLPLSETAAVPAAASQRRGEVPSSVFEVPTGARNVFPAANFNRDVTTNWWDTKVLDGHDAEAASELAVSLKNASFIVLDQEFYQVRMRQIVLVCSIKLYIISLTLCYSSFSRMTKEISRPRWRKSSSSLLALRSPSG